MKIEIVWVALVLLGALFRQVLRFQEALAELGRKMAVAQNSTQPPITYQNSITPPWLTNVWLLIAFSVAALIVATGYLNGITDAVVGAVLCIVGMTASGLLSRGVSRPGAVTYYRWAYHTLVNREADYRRDGDNSRADAARHFQQMMVTLLGKDFLNG